MSENRTGQVPRQVLLFSGHMIDAPERKERRFPPDNENIAAAAIGALLHKLDTGERDLAICGGACGGDLLFAEGSVARGAKLELYIPFDEQTFLVQSVDFADASWRERFYAAKTRATLHVMSDELSPLPSGEDPYERNNLWMLKSAMRFGWDKVAFIALWNGQGGDGLAVPSTSWTKLSVRRNVSIGSIPDSSGVEDCFNAKENLLHGDERSIGAAAFSPDGSRIVTCSYDATARLWDAATGNETVIFFLVTRPRSVRAAPSSI